MYRIDVQSQRGAGWQHMTPSQFASADAARRGCRMVAIQREDFGHARYRLIETDGLPTVEQMGRLIGQRLQWRDVPHTQALPDLDPLVSRAAVFAKQAHAAVSQRRKYTDEPYILHPAAVAKIVAGVAHTPEMLAAAFLHDIVEDTRVTAQRIEAVFGAEVAKLVGWLTDVSCPSDGNRAARKAIDRDHLAQATGHAQTIKLADLIHNAEDILEHDPSFARVYVAEMAALLDVLTAGDPSLRARAVETVDAALRKLH